MLIRTVIQALLGMMSSLSVFNSEDEAKKSTAKLVYKSRSRRNNALGKIKENYLLSWGLNVS